MTFNVERGEGELHRGEVLGTVSASAPIESPNRATPRTPSIFAEDDGLEPIPRHRTYYLDWLRIIAIYLVVIFHCVQALAWVKLWKGPQALLVEIYMAQSIQVGMPIFFHISGRAQALASQKSWCASLRHRFLRLVLPFCVCYVILIPPWLFIHKKDEEGVPKNIFAFIWWYWQPRNFYFDPAWLWFLPMLFIATAISMPVLSAAESLRPSNSIASAVLWLALTAWLKFGEDLSWAFCVCPLFGPLVTMLLPLFVPFPSRDLLVPSLPSIAKRQWFAIQGSTIVFVTSAVGLACSIRYRDDSALSANVLNVLMFTTFYLQGYCTERWLIGCSKFSDPIEPAERELTVVSDFRKFVDLYRLFGALILLTFVFASGPVSQYPDGHPWEKESYPLYSGSFMNEPAFAMFHVLGTWAFIAFAVAIAQSYVNQEIHAFVYKHASQSVLVVYIFHWMFIKVLAFYVSRDLGLLGNLWASCNVLLSVVGGVGGPLLIYAMLLRCPKLGMLFGL